MKYNLKDFQPGDVEARASDPIRGRSIQRYKADQAELVRRWKGRSPQEAATLMCAEFEHRFPDWKKVVGGGEGGLGEQGKGLETVAFPSSNTWYELGDNLKCIARRFVGNDEYLEYWGSMRELWVLLMGDKWQADRRKNYRQLDQGRSSDDACPIVKMDHCHLCWRAVPRRRGVKSNLFCQMHTFEPLRSRDPEYRRRKRMLSRWLGDDSKGGMYFSRKMRNMLSAFAPYRNIQVACSGEDGEGCVDKLGVAQSATKLDEIWYSNPAVIIQALPHVSTYLAECSVNFDSTADIVRALEEPYDKNEGDDAAYERRVFYEKARLYFYDYYERLILAEIWLEMEANTIHGGKRKGAGRSLKTMG